MSILYGACRVLTRTIGALCRMRVEGVENIPASGAFILAANHISYFDPPLLGSMISRQMNYLAKDTLFKRPMISRVLKAVNAIPVKRGVIDRRALEQCVDLLKEGKGLILFPEGTRSKTGDFLNPKPGIGMIAHRARCSIVPAFLVGSDSLSDCLIGKRRLQIIFGSPITEQWVASLEPEKASYLKIAGEAMDRIRQLKESA